MKRVTLFAAIALVAALTVGATTAVAKPASVAGGKTAAAGTTKESAKATAAPGSIVDIVLAASAATPPQFTILKAAVLAADPAVLETLSSRGQRTVFAPTDAAFVALLDELDLTAGQLLGNQALVTVVLLYHVAPGNRSSADVLGSSRIRTLNGGFLGQSGGVLTDANGRTSNIVATDIAASNGVIHVIDRVVLP